MSVYMLNLLYAFCILIHILLVVAHVAHNLMWCRRLKETEERTWTNESIDSIAMKHFPNINREATLKRPILYSNWLSKDYMPVEQEKLRDYVQARLKVLMTVSLSDISLYS